MGGSRWVSGKSFKSKKKKKEKKEKLGGERVEDKVPPKKTEIGLRKGLEFKST
jgi:hypothetical protein